MTFQPREVVVAPNRTFKEYYALGEEIGKYELLHPLLLVYSSSF